MSLKGSSGSSLPLSTFSSGIATFAMLRRRKEIGIRKVLGASVSHLVVRMSGEFIAPVAVSLVPALPPARFAMNAFLDRFAYRIDVHPMNFLIAGGIVAVLTLACTGYQVIRASTVDPVETLRTE